MKGTQAYISILAVAAFISISGLFLPFYASERFVQFSPWLALGIGGVLYAGLQKWRPVAGEFFFESRLANGQLHLILAEGLMLVTWGVLIVPAPLALTTVFGEPVTRFAVVTGKSTYTARRGCDHWLDLSINSAPLHLGSCVSASKWARFTLGDRLQVRGRATWFGVVPE